MEGWTSGRVEGSDRIRPISTLPLVHSSIPPPLSLGGCPHPVSLSSQDSLPVRRGAPAVRVGRGPPVRVGSNLAVAAGPVGIPQGALLDLAAAGSGEFGE